MALDWYGEDLVWHILSSLRDDDDPRIPPEYNHALREFRKLDDEAKYQCVKTVLEKTYPDSNFGPGSCWP